MEFCGSYKSTIDSKWRLKIPVEYREYLYSKYGNSFYIASLDFESLVIFPDPVLEEIKKKSDTNPDLAFLMTRLNITGRSSVADSQGKIMVPEAMRIRNPSLKGTVMVVAVVNHLEVYTLEMIERIFQQPKITNEQFAKILAGGTLDRT